LIEIIVKYHRDNNKTSSKWKSIYYCNCCSN